MIHIFTSDPYRFGNVRHVEGIEAVSRCRIVITSPASSDSAPNETSSNETTLNETTLNDSTGLDLTDDSMDVSPYTAAILQHQAFWRPGTLGHLLSDISEEDAERRSLYSSFNGEQ